MAPFAVFESFESYVSLVPIFWKGELLDVEIKLLMSWNYMHNSKVTSNAQIHVHCFRPSEENHTHTGSKRLSVSWNAQHSLH